MKRRYLLIGIALAWILLLFVRETGIISLNVHTSELAVEQSFNHLTTHVGEKIPLSFNLVIRRRGRQWLSHTRVILRAPRIDIEGELMQPTFKGNDWVPLHKNFTMTYECHLHTPDEQAPAHFTGAFSGTVTVRITGLCTRHEARRLAMAKARDQIQVTVQKLNP